MDKYSFNVSLYEEHSLGIENTWQLISMSNERLKLYYLFEKHESFKPNELELHLENSPFLPLLKAEKPSNIAEIRKMDYLTHLMLRVLYSITDHDFFIKNELRWFKARFTNMPHVERLQFLKLNKFVYAEASEQDKTKYGLKGSKWYKVDFKKATSLMRLQLYSMSGGYLFVPEHKLVFCVLDQMQRYLKEALIDICKLQPSWPDQLQCIISFLSPVRPPYVQVSNKVTLATLDEDVLHFPLCMKSQYENLKLKHHLKHFSRVQYGLFLKDLGLSIDEALDMWRQEFTKIMTERVFNRDYIYFFKHQYGLVGSKITYRAQQCDSIIEENVGLQQVNGCPFKHWGSNILIERLKEDEVPEINKIIELKKIGKCKEACTVYFQCVHKCKTNTISHPVQYYENSCKAEETDDIEDLFSSNTEN